MLRVLGLTAPFNRAVRRLASPGTAERRAVVDVLRDMCRAELPGPDDFEALALPVGVAWVRHIAPFRLWLVYRFDATRVTVSGLVDREPVRVE